MGEVWARCRRGERGVGGAGEAQEEWQRFGRGEGGGRCRRGEGKAAGGVGGARRGHVFASLEFPELANAQPSNFGPLPYFRHKRCVSPLGHIWCGLESIATARLSNLDGGALQSQYFLCILPLKVMVVKAGDIISR